MPSRNREGSYHDEGLSESADASTLLPISPRPSARSAHRQSRTDARRPNRATYTDGQRRPLPSSRGIDRGNIEPPRTRYSWLDPTRPERKKGSRRTAVRFPPHQQRERAVARQSRFGQDVSNSPFPLSAAIDAHYHAAENTSVVETARNTRAGILTKSIKKLRRRIEAWHEDLAKAEKYKTYDRYGELIKANLGTIRKGQTDVTVVDYFDEKLSNLTIPLDQAKTPQGNMDDYFKKHRKHLAAERELRPRIKEGEGELEALQKELTAIEQGTWQPPENPRQTTRSIVLHRAGERTSQREQRQGPFRRFTSADGLAIYVGRNARENDELTFGFAKSDDLWLHARGTPGSHVVVRLKKGSDPPPETIRDAATLALFYSDLKKSGKGDVIYTRRKWVKKAKGQAPGAVVVTQEKSIHVVLEKNRLDALKARSAHE